MRVTSTVFVTVVHGDVELVSLYAETARIVRCYDLTAHGNSPAAMLHTKRNASFALSAVCDRAS